MSMKLFACLLAAAARHHWRGLLLPRLVRVRQLPIQWKFPQVRSHRRRFHLPQRRQSLLHDGIGCGPGSFLLRNGYLRSQAGRRQHRLDWRGNYRSQGDEVSFSISAGYNPAWVSP